MSETERAYDAGFNTGYDAGYKDCNGQVEKIKEHYAKMEEDYKAMIFENIALRDVTDMINSPPHYTQGKVECIDAMESAFGREELATYCKIAAFKYIWREETKNGTEDVKKAIWYLQKYLELKGVEIESKT